MQLTDYVFTIGSDLKNRYGEKIHKLTLHGNFSCPNRDGTLGKGGCTFCNVAAFADETQSTLSIKEQLILRADEVQHKAKKHLAYFQAYTSTYGEIQQLANFLWLVAQAADIADPQAKRFSRNSHVLSHQGDVHCSNDKTFSKSVLLLNTLHITT